MLIPPRLDSEARRQYDLNDLRTYYIFCEELGIAQEEDIQKSFGFLMRWAGNYKFLEEFMLFRRYIEKRKREIHK